MLSNQPFSTETGSLTVHPGNLLLQHFSLRDVDLFINLLLSSYVFILPILDNGVLFPSFNA